MTVPRLRDARSLVAALCAALVLAACSGSPRPKPTPLEPLTPQIGGRLVWSQKVDSVQFPLLIAVNETASSGGVFTIAGTDGTVLALQADTGRELWRGTVGERLSAGVGSDGRFAAVVTRDNELVTLEAGRIAWRARLGAHVSTAPLVAGERVFVMSVDRVVGRILLHREAGEHDQGSPEERRRAATPGSRRCRSPARNPRLASRSPVARTNQSKPKARPSTAGLSCLCPCLSLVS